MRIGLNKAPGDRWKQGEPDRLEKIGHATPTHIEGIGTNLPETMIAEEAGHHIVRPEVEEVVPFSAKKYAGFVPKTWWRTIKIRTGCADLLPSGGKYFRGESPARAPSIRGNCQPRSSARES